MVSPWPLLAVYAVEHSCGYTIRRLRRWGEQSMKARTRIVSVLLAAALSLTTAGVPHAVAAKSSASSLGASYANCDALHKRWLYGVAKSIRAARRQVRTGHYKPHVSLAG